MNLGLSPVGCDAVPDNFRLHGRVPFFAANLNESLPPETRGCFDCLVATELIEHLENPRHFLRQCFSALRPGGLLLLSTPNVDSPFSKALFIRTGDFHWFQEPEYRSGGHITPIPRRLLERALGEAGFESLRIEGAVRDAVPPMRWWRMRTLTWAIRLLAGPASLGSQTLIAEAVRPARAP
jgi:SAM-dependent methyltransferase